MQIKITHNKGIFLKWCYYFSLLILVLLSFSWFYMTNEDAWITYRYVKNLANGYGLVANPYGVTQLGASSLVHVLILATLNKFLSIDINIASKLLSIFSTLMIAIINFFTTKKILLKQPQNNNYVYFVNIIFVMLLASSSYFLVWITQGLETTFYSMLLFALYSMIVWYVYSPNKDRKILSYVLAALLFIVTNTRPESMTIFAIVLTIQYIIYIKESKLKDELYNLLRFSFVFIALTAILLLWQYVYFGDTSTNPSYVKLALSVWHDGLNEYFFKYFQTKGFLFSAIVIISVLLTVVVTTKLILKSKEYKTGIYHFLPMMFFSVCIVFSYVSGGDYMSFYRFIMPYYPFLILLLIFTPILYFRTLKIVIALQLAILTIVIFSNLRYENIPDTKWWNINFQNPNTIDKNNAYHSATNKIKNIMQEHPNEFYAISEAGYVPYHLDFNSIDIMGLNQKEIARAHKIYSLDNVFNATRDFVLSQTPRLIVVRSGLIFDNIQNSIKCDPGLAWFFNPYIQSAFFKKYYKLIGELPNKMHINQDFPLFERKNNIPHVSYIKGQEQKNQEFLLTGFYFEKSKIWMSTLSRVMIMPNSSHKELVFKGHIPDIHQYEGNNFNLKFSFNDDSVGDKIFFEKNIKKSGFFEIRLPLNSLITKPNHFFLLTLKASKLKATNGDERDLSCIFEEVGFE